MKDYELPPLPYPKNALEPYISAKTLEYHYEKHHRGYLSKVKKAVGGTEHEKKSPEEIIFSVTEPSIFNPGAQVWNHTFYWNCMHPQGGGDPPKELARLLKNNFGSVDAFKQKLTQSALGQFGSGWAWLVQSDHDKLEIVSTSDADNPLRHGQKPLLTIDVWEHAYYLDYQNERNAYVEAFMQNLINWEFIVNNIQTQSSFKAA